MLIKQPKIINNIDIIIFSFVMLAFYKKSTIFALGKKN